MADEDIRAELDALIRARGDDYASLSRMLGRNAAYIQQFIKRGVPRKLDEDIEIEGLALTKHGANERGEVDLLRVPRLDESRQGQRADAGLDGRATAYSLRRAAPICRDDAIRHGGKIAQICLGTHQDLARIERLAPAGWSSTATF